MLPEVAAISFPKTLRGMQTASVGLRKFELCDYVTSFTPNESLNTRASAFTSLSVEVFNNNHNNNDNDDDNDYGKLFIRAELALSAGEISFPAVLPETGLMSSFSYIVEDRCFIHGILGCPISS